MKGEVAILGSLSQIVLTVRVDVKQDLAELLEVYTTHLCSRATTTKPWEASSRHIVV